MAIAACSSGGDDQALFEVSSDLSVDPQSAPAGGAEDEAVDGSFKVVQEDGVVVFQQTPSGSFDPMIIRNGTVELRIEPGAFGASTSQVRAIADGLGGYVASGETHIEEIDDVRYAVGWYTIRIPSDRFDDAVRRIEQLGERVSASLSSQDVTEDYVDLEGRLGYWRDQEAFYRRLMAEATAIEDLVTLQTRMQDVLLNIEQIEGRLRYLDSRTQFATLTVGLTEVPSDGAVPPPPPSDPGRIAEAFDQAGEVLLATVSFIIVSAAVAVPIGILVLFGYAVYRLVLRTSRKESPVEG